MTEIRVGTVSDAAGSGPAVLTGQAASRFWAAVDADSTTPVAIDSLNLSSITDNGIGNYDLNFSNNFDGANTYALFGAGHRDVLSLTTSGAWFCAVSSSTDAAESKTTALCRVKTCTQNGNALDADDIGFSATGDLA